jgi:nucleoside-diphosphate-sugar epimerase
VGDVASAFHIAVIKQIPSGVYNLGSGTSTSVYEVCKTAERLITGQTFMSEQLRNTNKNREITDFWADTTKTKQALDWTVSTSLEEGIKNHIHALKSDYI